MLLVSDKDSQNPQAIKAVSKEVVEKGGRHARRRALLELEVLQRYAKKSPFLVQLAGLKNCPEYWFLVLEYCPGGSLSIHLRESRRQYKTRKEGRGQRRSTQSENGERMPIYSELMRGLGETRSHFYAVQITCAVSFLHSNGILHRDLKPSNCLLGADGHIRLADFGTCKDVGCDAESLSDSEIRRLGTKLGTTDYMAPEVLRGHEYGKGIDWWSFGILLHELIFGVLPFPGQNESDIISLIVAEDDPVVESKNGAVSEEALDLLRLLLRKENDCRLGCSPSGAEQILEHTWFDNKERSVRQIRARACEPPWKPALRAGAADVEWVNKKWLGQSWSVPGTSIQVGTPAMQSGTEHKNRSAGLSPNSDLLRRRRNMSLEPLQGRTPKPPRRDDGPLGSLFFVFCCSDSVY